MVSSNGMNEMEQWMGGKLFHLRRKRKVTSNGMMECNGMVWNSKSGNGMIRKNGSGSEEERGIKGKIGD